MQTMMYLTGYQTTEELYQSEHSVVYRAKRLADNELVILKVLQSQYLSSEEMAWFRREYEVMHAIDVEGVAKALGLETEQHRWFIVLEDFGGDSLDKLNLAGNLTVPDFLKLAIKITEALSQIHQQRIIHKDINPSNIVFNPQTGQVKLIDLGISSVFSQENPAFHHPDALEGTLAYMSPEQTGRLNRTVDFRTDLYSLGITFYELLTGQRPFSATDPLEMVHCHIAREPTSPDQLRPELPPIIANIVLKLMAKNVKDRYQTAIGLQADLQTCLCENQLQGTIADFVLGRRDNLRQLKFSHKLYGRQKEVTILLDAFDTARQGTADLILIAGHSGVGKSSLVREVYRPITARHGIFIEGKFERLQRRFPYYGWRQAMSQFVAYLLTEPEAQRTVWRDKILQAVGKNGKVLTDVIPNLILLLGPQPEVPQLAAVESLNRFRYTFQRFLQAIITLEHPICLFLDDLQWADTASLSLLQGLLQDALPYILVVGAYRDNEVDSTHNLPRILYDLQEANINYHTVHLQNLSVSQVNELITDALVDVMETVHLATLVHQKTEGNAFFVKAFLQTMFDQQLLQFNPTDVSGSWHWSPTVVRQLSSTDNVIDLLVAKVQTLPPQTQTTLKIAACIGARFDLSTLATIAEATVRQMSQSLEPALMDDILISNIPAEDNPTSYRFAHDRIHSAVYSLIPLKEQQHYHWQIGNLLWDNLSLEERAERPFAILNQWHNALNLLENETVKIRFTELSLIASRKAKTAAAFSSAYDYLREANRLLPVNNSDYWQTHYELMIALTTEMAETAYLVGKFTQAEQLIAVVLDEAKSLLDLVPAYEIRIQAYISQNKMEEATQIGLQILEQLGEHFLQEPTATDILSAMAQTRSNMQAKPLAKLLDPPEMTDPTKLATLHLLFLTNLSLFFTNSELSLLVSLRLVDLSMLYGNTAVTGWTYILYAYILCEHEGDIETAFELGQLGLEAIERYNAKIFEAKAIHIFAAFVQHWKQHVQDTLPLLLNAFRSGLENGDLIFAGFAAGTYCQHSYLAGKELGQLHEEITMYGNDLTKFKQDFTYLFLSVDKQVVLNLLGKVEEPHRLTGTACNEQDLLALVQESSNAALLFTFCLNKMILCYLFHVFPEALDYATQVEPHISTAPGTIRIHVYHFYDSLIRLAVFPERSGEEQQRILQRVASNQEKVEYWVQHAPMNNQAKWHLVEAERCRILGQSVSAREHYDQAIACAKRHGYIQEAALAYELAGRFYLNRDQDELAEFYLRKSSHAYGQWGAVAKVHHLGDLYPHFLKSPSKSPSGTLHTHPYLLDMNSMLKASQALSQEVVLSRLLERMMQIVMENAGADRGVLVLVEGDQWVVQAETTVNHATTLLQAQPLETCVETMGTTVIRYVSQTQDNIILENAMQSDLFRHDPYIASQRPQSILCLPIQHQGHLRGILYLENNLASSTFTEDRIELLNLLLSQAAISLENAFLYSNLTVEISERKQAEVTLRRNEERFRALFERSNDAVFIMNLDGIHLTANQQAADMFGYTIDELIGMSFEDVVVPGQLEEAREKLDLLLARERIPIYERLVQKKDGTVFYVEINIALVSDENGQPLHIQSIVRDITDRKQIESQILASLQEKEVMLKEIHHRVKNNMQVISSLLDLQADSLQDEQVRGLFKESQDRIKSMALIHEQLYQVPDLARIDFVNYVESLTSHLLRSYGAKEGNIVLHLDIAPLYLSIETAIPCGLIINELVSNAFKHAFPNGQAGQIWVTTLHKAETEQLTLQIKDNGVGLPANIDLQQPRSLGMTLVMTLVKQINGMIEWQNDHGLKFRITFKNPMTNLTGRV